MEIYKIAELLCFQKKRNRLDRIRRNKIGKKKDKKRRQKCENAGHKHTRQRDCRLDVLALPNKLKLVTNLWRELMLALDKEYKPLKKPMLLIYSIEPAMQTFSDQKRYLHANGGSIQKIICINLFIFFTLKNLSLPICRETFIFNPFPDG